MHAPPSTAEAKPNPALRAIVALLAAAAALYLALALYVDWRALFAAIRTLGLAALGGGLLLASLNYLLRFARWHDILRRMGQRVPAGANVRIYVGGLALTATPGKLGETLRSALLLRWQVPVGASLAAFFIDRLTDLIGVLLLAALSGGGASWWMLAVAALAVGVGLRYAAGTRWAAAGADWLDRHHRLGALAALLRTGLAHYRAAWRLLRVVPYVLIAIAAYGLQALVFAAYVDALWPGLSWMASVRIFATSTLAGAASMIPGGLGAMELALIAQLTLAGMPLVYSTAAALAVRAVTLWFAILLGLACLLSLRREVAVASTA
jgi:uncharacterized membrane protein YbhN (UPF0104 family)